MISSSIRIGPKRRSATSMGLALALLLGLSSCGSDASLTEVVVVVNSDLMVPSEIDQLLIRVVLPDGSDANASAILGGGNPGLPRTLGLQLRDGNRTGEYQVISEARRGGVSVVLQRMRFDFVPGQRMRLDLTLNRACQGLSCGFGQTCVRGACQSDLATLSPFSGTAAGLMEAMSLDGAPTTSADAGLDR